MFPSLLFLGFTLLQGFLRAYALDPWLQSASWKHSCGLLVPVAVSLESPWPLGWWMRGKGNRKERLSHSWYEAPKEGFYVGSPLCPEGWQSFVLIPSLILLGLTTLAVNSLGSVTPRDPRESCSYYFPPPNLTGVRLIPLMENLHFGDEYVLNTLDVQYSRIWTWVICPDVCSKDCLSFQIKSLESRVVNQLVEGFEAQWLGSPAMGLKAKHQDALLQIISTFCDMNTSFNTCHLDLHLCINTLKVGILGERVVI